MGGTGLSYDDLNQDIQIMPAPPAPPAAVNNFIDVDLIDVDNILMPPPPPPPRIVPMNLIVQAEVHGPPPPPARVAPPALAAPPAPFVVPKYLWEDAVDDDQMPTLSPQNTVQDGEKVDHDDDDEESEVLQLVFSMSVKHLKAERNFTYNKQHKPAGLDHI